MPLKTKVAGVKLKRGKNMKTGPNWRLLSPTEHAFKATLLWRKEIGDESVAIFRVSPHPEAK